MPVLPASSQSAGAGWQGVARDGTIEACRFRRQRVRPKPVQFRGAGVHKNSGGVVLGENESAPGALETAAAATETPEAGSPFTSADETPVGAGLGGAPFYPLDPRKIALDRLTGLIFFIVVSLAGAIALLIGWLVSGATLLFWGGSGLWILISGLLLWLALDWPARDHRFSSWSLGPTGLEIHRGVFWRHRLSVPLARLQHADISQGPLQRRYGIAKLTVHTAGTANASVELDGIAHETAVWLRDRLISQRESGDVV